MEQNCTFSKAAEEQERRLSKLKELEEKQKKRSKAFYPMLAAYAALMISLFCVNEFHAGWIMWVAYTAFGAEIVFCLLVFIYPNWREIKTWISNTFGGMKWNQ